MKKHKRMKVAIGVIFLCIGVVACKNPTTEKPVENTPTPTVAPMATIAPTVTPTLTPAPIEGIEISEENFGDKVFCAYLKEKFDTDKNGYFSDEERKAVTVIWAGMRNYLTPFSEMKGFSYFPELESLTLNSAAKVEICDVPKLSSIELEGTNGAQKYKLGDLTIKNCPVLESVRIVDISAILDQGKETVEFVVENCPKLQWMTIDGEGMHTFDKVSLKVSGTPELLLSTYYGFNPKEMVLDTAVFVIKDLPMIDMKNKTVDASEMKVTWEGELVTEYEAALTELEDVILKLQEGFFVEVQEVSPALYDETGRKAYQVLVNNPYLSRENYGIANYD